MPASVQATEPSVRPIRNLRWWIGAILFASTVINYIDRQTLSLLWPYLKEFYHWTNSDYAKSAHRLSHCVLDWPKSMRKADGSRRHPARAHPFCSLVLDCIDGHFTGRRVLQFRDIQISSGRWRICQLAGRDKGLFGVVPEA
jgi:hypothetical protein